MNTLLQRLLASSVVLSAALLSACVPTRWTNAPAVAGEVVDRRTSQPVAGALVSMTADKASVQTHTDNTGGFRLPAITHWDLLWLLETGQIPHGTLRVQAVGYRSLTSGPGEAPTIRDVVSGSDIVYHPTDRDDFERVHVVLAPGT